MSRAKHHEPGDEGEELGASPRTRLKGVLFLIGGAIGSILALVASAYLAKHGYFPKRGGVPAMVLTFIPLAAVLVGFVELLTGFDFVQAVRKWDDLPTWQRGLMMILIAFSPFIFYSIGVEFF
jgi:hypothetical protein